MDILGIDSLFAELTVGLGLAMAGGNAWAIIQNARGRGPDGAASTYRAGRAWFFVAAGTIMTIWGILSLIQT